MVRALLLLVLVACKDTPLPNPEGLTVSGSGGIPVFTFTGREAEVLAVVQPGTGATLWSVGPIGGDGATSCINLLFPDTDITWAEPPMGNETTLFVGQEPPPATLSAAEAYEATLGVCTQNDGAVATFENSTAFFDVMADGEVVTDCDRSICP